MNKVASYLQEHIAGEVFDSERIRHRFATDASILTIKPSLVVHPRTTNDVRKVARFSWQLAEKGHILPVTARGNGTDLSGAAIGKGIIVSFPAHLNRILELDTKQRLVRVQPGVNFKSLQETLHTHGLFLPPFPASYEYSTVGGAIANNAAGIKSHKYGDMRKWVDKLEVVLANGEIIQTGRISKRELSKKLGLATLEGELYRAIDAILKDDMSLIDGYKNSLKIDKDSVGYALEHVPGKGGSVDLTPLFVGSQGTLGIVTEAILRVAAYTPASSLAIASFSSIDDALDAAEQLQALKPSVLEVLDGDVLQFVQKHNNYAIPADLSVADRVPTAVLMVECDDSSHRVRAKFLKKTIRIVSVFTETYLTTDDFDELEKLWALRYSTSMFMSHDVGGLAALPVIEDVSVPPAALHQCIGETKALGKRHHCELAIWVHAASANIHVLPLIDLSKLGDRQKVFKLMDEYYRMIIKLGGTVASEHGDGRLRVPYTRLQVGDEVMAVFERLKQAADPYGTLNPGVKTGTSVKDLIEILRKDYSFTHLADFLPKM